MPAGSGATAAAGGGGGDAEPTEAEWEAGLEALSGLISGRARSDGRNWSHAFEMMEAYLEVRPW
jgi:hypothetical protein